MVLALSKKYFNAKMTTNKFLVQISEILLKKPDNIIRLPRDQSDQIVQFLLFDQLGQKNRQVLRDLGHQEGQLDPEKMWEAK